MKFLISMLLAVTFVSCSGTKKAEDDSSAEAGVELSDADAFLEDAADEVGEEPVALDDATNMDQMSDAPMATEESSGLIQPSGGMATYTVQQNETLMMIAFKLYGDYGKWKDLARMNATSLGSNNVVSVGTQLQYEAPAQEFVWNPEGNPYLIKTGDTLGTISSDTYGTTRYWKNIWNNNKPLIKDPNLIFAGFTIYTPMIDRGVANN